MRAVATLLCAVPRACFSEERLNALPMEQLRRFLADLTVIERRLAKDAVLEDEIFRYGRLCQQVEEVALSNATFAPGGFAFRRALAKGRFPVLEVGSEYTDLVRELELRGVTTGVDAEARLGATILRPEHIEPHTRAFARTAVSLDFHQYPAIRQRLWFLSKRVLRSGAGLVEIPDPLGATVEDASAARARGVDGRSLWERLLAWLRKAAAPSVPPGDRLLHAAPLTPAAQSTQASDWLHYGERDRGRFMEQRLRAEIELALERGTPVNLSNQRHNMATELLAEFIHKQAGSEPSAVAVVYNESQQARPFPLRCLDPIPDGWAPTREFHVGLVSMRHLMLDRYIDINWYRNVETPSTGGLVAADEKAFQVSMRNLAALLDANRGQRLRLHVYHTGFVPAVIGFYRALVTTLSSGAYPPGCLQVLPKLQPKADDSGHIEGAAWPS
jgi:hypothetical protein